MMFGETSIVLLVFVVVVVVVVVIVVGSSFVVVGRIDVNLEIGTAFVEVDVDVDVDIISIAVSSKTSSSLQKSTGLSFEAGDVGSITSLKKLVKSFAVSFVICWVDVDNISIAVSMLGIKIDQISFAFS